MRRRRRLWQRLHELQRQKLTRVIKLGSRLSPVDIELGWRGCYAGHFQLLRRDKLRLTMRREGRYLLRSNLREEDPATLWKYYIRLTEIEHTKADLAIRPIFHQTDEREAHIFIAAYCLCHTTPSTALTGAWTHAGEVCHNPNGR